MSGRTEFAYRLGAAARRQANWIQLLKFGMVGATGYVVNLSVFALLTGGIGIHHAAAAVCAFLIAVGNNFVWNRRWTFDSAAGRARVQMARFLIVSIASLCLNLAVLQILVASGVAEIPAQAIAVAFAMPFNFVGNRLWTFS